MNFEKVIYKKIELWLMALVIILMLIFSGLTAFVVHIKLSYDYEIPFITKTTMFVVEIPSNIKDLIGKNKKFSSPLNKKYLESFSYFDKKNNIKKINGFLGEPLDYDSYLLMPRYDYTYKTSIIDIFNLKTFSKVKTVIPDKEYLQSKIDFSNLLRFESAHLNYPQHPIISSDGNIIFLIYGSIVKMDNANNVIWINDDYFYHHSIEADNEGNIWVPSRIEETELHEVTHRSQITDEGITCISKEGKTVFHKSLLDIFVKNNLSKYLYDHNDFRDLSTDPFHINDIQPVDFDGKFQKKGDVFLNLRSQSMIMQYRPDKDSLIYYFSDLRANGQHDVDIINDSTIAYFNNNTWYHDKNKRKKRGKTIDIIFHDLKTRKSSLYLYDQIKNHNIKTSTQGLYTLVPEEGIYLEATDNQRVIYLDNDGNKVWEWFNYDYINHDLSNIYTINWSRFYYLNKDINNVSKFIMAND